MLFADIIRNYGKKILLLAAVTIGCHSCVEKDYRLGGNLIPTNQQYDIYSAVFDLEDIQMKMADSLSGYSSSRITVGAIRDDDFGLTTRGCALTLVPFYDSLDFGQNTKIGHFHFSAVGDSVSVASKDQMYILQNINVYELSKKLGDNYDTNADISEYIGPRATDGALIYDGLDSLAFDFSHSFAQKYYETLSGDITICDDLSRYLDKLPGIYIDTDKPAGNGGRINLFDLQLEYNSSYAITGNYAELFFSAEYDGEQKDTSFLFYFSPVKKFDIDSLVYNSSQGALPQYCYNVTGHESRAKAGAAGQMMRVEGGGGLKPVVMADELYRLMNEEIGKHCSDISKAVISKASLILPYKYVYEDMFRYPDVLSPTCRIKTDTLVAFAGLTDSSAGDEDQGDINRSLKRYSPDITYHAQSLLKLEEGSDMSNYDIWFLIIANETHTSTTSGNSDSSDMSDYYRYLMYNSYYNSMYGGYGGYGGYGYGGYGGYGYGSYGYNDYYSNYYSYMLAAMYASNSNTSSTSVTQEMDKDRYYNAVLYGPQCPDEALRPKFKITYAIPKDQQ